MSEPKRYEYVSDGYTARFINPKTGHAAPKGDYVRYEDYARLKAEVERLRKAGDAMATNIPRMVTCQVTAHEAVDFINAWNAAKEGRPNE